MTRQQIVEILRQLRETIERELAEDGLPAVLLEDQAALLSDVCRALGLDDAEMQQVIGEEAGAVLWSPIRLTVMAA
jgi:hypothetical protein